MRHSEYQTHSNGGKRKSMSRRHLPFWIERTIISTANFHHDRRWWAEAHGIEVMQLNTHQPGRTSAAAGSPLISLTVRASGIGFRDYHTFVVEQNAGS